MLDGAAWREGAGHGEEDDLFVGPFGTGVVVCGDAAGGYALCFGGVGDVAGEIRWDGGMGREAYEKTIPSGKESPALSSGMVGSFVCTEELWKV